MVHDKLPRKFLPPLPHFTIAQRAQLIQRCESLLPIVTEAERIILLRRLKDLRVIQERRLTKEDASGSA